MATRHFAYNPTHITIAGTTLTGDISVSVSAQDYYIHPGGLTWWNGLDEITGYVICERVPAGNQPTPLGNIGTVRFWKSDTLTDASFISLVNRIYGQTFSTVLNSLNYLNTGGHWTSYPPVILYDTNTIAWYDSTVVSSITKDGSNRVSAWADKLGSGHNLLQATGSNQPLYTTNGIDFNLYGGYANTNLHADFTYSQPNCIYSVLQVPALNQWWYNIFGKRNATSYMGPFLANGPDGTTGLRIKAYKDGGGGTVYSPTVDITYGQYYVIRTTFSSTCALQVNAGSTVTVDSNNLPFNGIDIGNSDYGTQRIILKEMICRTISDTTTNSDLIYAYLKAKYSL